MTSTAKSRRPAEGGRGPAALLGAAALAAAVPKCALCLFAYAGLGAALGLPTREFCGEAPGRFGASGLMLGLPAAGLCLFLGSFLGTRARRRLGKVRGYTAGAPTGPGSADRSRSLFNQAVRRQAGLEPFARRAEAFVKP